MRTTTTRSGLLEDVIQEIVRLVSKRRDLLSLALVNRQVCRIVVPILYRTLDLNGEDCQGVITRLARAPTLASHVRSLRLHSESSTQLGGPHLALAAAKIASSLHNLENFIWDVPNAHQRDEMWHELRKWCPNLRTIGTCFGPNNPTPGGPFYQFAQLRGLHLRFRDATQISTIERDWGFLDREALEVEQLSLLWKIIHSHSRDVEEVKISGNTVGARVSVENILCGTWPGLRRVTFDDVPMHQPIDHHMVLRMDPLVRFLVAHEDSLEEVRLAEPTQPQPAMLLIPPEYGPPKLKHFRGTVMQTLTLHCRETLQTLTITNVMHIGAPIMESLAGALADLRLTTLTVAFHLQGIHATNQIIRSVLGRCTGLRALDLSIFFSPSILIEDLPPLIRLMPSLISLHLTLVKHSREGSMADQVCRLARTHSQLRNIRLQFVGSGVRFKGRDRPPVLQFGDYAVVRNPRPRLIVYVEIEPRPSRETRWSGPPSAAEERWVRRGPYRLSLVEEQAELPPPRRTSSQFFGRVLSRVKSNLASP